MTIEYVLLLICVVGLLLKAVAFGPKRAFEEAGPKLGARVESQIATGTGFIPKGKTPPTWSIRQ